MGWADDLGNGFGDVVSNVVNPGNVLGKVTGSEQQAKAAQSGADLQYKLSEDQLSAQKDINAQNFAFQQQLLDYQKASRAQAVGLAQPSASTLAQMGTNLELQNQALMANMKALDRDNAILESIDPAIKESGKQALELMQGQNAAILKPLQDQQTRQRSQLEQTLAERLGPDYATSSAGQQALAQFDQNAQLTTAQAQQQSLGQLLGVVQNANMNPVANASNAFNTLNGLNQTGLTASQNMTGQQIAAFTGNAPNIVPQAGIPNYNNLISAAGNSQVGQAIQGQNMGNLFNTGAQIGGGLLIAKAAAA